MLGGFGVLYNPIFKFPLSRDIWSIVNVATICLLAIHMWLGTRRPWTGTQAISTPSRKA